MQLLHRVTSARCTQLVRVGACDASLTGMCELAYIRLSQSINGRSASMQDPLLDVHAIVVARPPMERALWKLS